MLIAELEIKFRQENLGVIKIGAIIQHMDGREIVILFSYNSQ